MRPYRNQIGIVQTIAAGKISAELISLSGFRKYADATSPTHFFIVNADVARILESGWQEEKYC